MVGLLHDVLTAAVAGCLVVSFLHENSLRLLTALFSRSCTGGYLVICLITEQQVRGLSRGSDRAVVRFTSRLITG